MSIVVLNEETAMEIYRLRDSDHHVVAKTYGVSYHTVKDVWSGKTWSKVTGHQKVKADPTVRLNPFMHPAKDLFNEIRVRAVLVEELETTTVNTIMSAKDLMTEIETDGFVVADENNNPIAEESFLLVVTPEIAQWILDIAGYDKQRPIRSSNIIKYALDMEHNKFGTTTIEMGRYKDTLCLLNGQTRLNAVVRSGETVKFNMLVHPGTSESDFSDLYAEMDSGALRSYADTARTEPKFVGAGLTETQANKLMAAVKPIIVGFKNQSSDKYSSVYRVRSRTYRRDVALSFVHEAVLYHTATYGASKMLSVVLQRAGIVSVALLTIRYQPEKALKFWEDVAKADGLAAKSPQMRLLEELVAAAKSHTRWSYESTFSRRVARCWNAYFLDKKTLVSLKAINPIDEIKIEGTPYNGKRFIQLDDKGNFVDMTPVPGVPNA